MLLLGKGMEYMRNALKAPQVKQYIDWLRRIEYRSATCQFSYDDLTYQKIDELLSSVGKLKGEISKYNKYLSEQIKNRTKDINVFLELAGFKYHFDVKLDGEDNASAILE